MALTVHKKKNRFVIFSLVDELWYIQLFCMFYTIELTLHLLNTRNRLAFFFINYILSHKYHIFNIIVYVDNFSIKVGF